MFSYLKIFLRNPINFISIVIVPIIWGYNFNLRDGLKLNQARASEAKPDYNQRNVLLLVSDDHGLQAGCYGNTVIKTPNLDRLAEEGVIFTNAFATCASCSAARSVIYTGLFNHTNGQYGHMHLPYDQHTHEWVKSIPSFLNERGYYTGIIGKFHVQPRKVYSFHKSVGNRFDEGPSIGRDGLVIKRETKKFLSSKPDKPFFLVIGFHDPHRTGPGEFGGKEPYPGEKKVTYSPEDIPVPPWLPDIPETRIELSRYYRAISRMDQQIGLILEVLEQTGRKEETMIIYTSDGGPPFPGAKTNIYDPGIRVPFIISIPNQKNMGFENNAMISHIDILPTILDWVGMEPPYKVYSPKYKIPNRLSRMIGLEEKEYYTLPGRSLLPILYEKNPSEWNTIYASHTFHEVTMYYPMRSIRTKEFKYILNIANDLDYPFATDLWESLTWQGLLERNSNKLGIKSIESYLNRPKEELYNLKKDPYESNNLAENPEYKDIIADLSERLKSFQARTQDIWLLKYNYWEKIEKLKERYK